MFVHDLGVNIITGAPPPVLLTLVWTTPVGPVDGYRMYHGTSPGTYLQSAGNGIPVQGNIWTSSVLTGVNYFANTAYNSTGESAKSNEICYNFTTAAAC